MRRDHFLRTAITASLICSLRCVWSSGPDSFAFDTRFSQGRLKLMDQCYILTEVASPRHFPPAKETNWGIFIVIAHHINLNLGLSTGATKLGEVSCFCFQFPQFGTAPLNDLGNRTVD